MAAMTRSHHQFVPLSLDETGAAATSVVDVTVVEVVEPVDVDDDVNWDLTPHGVSGAHSRTSMPSVHRFSAMTNTSRRVLPTLRSCESPRTAASPHLGEPATIEEKSPAVHPPDASAG